MGISIAHTPRLLFPILTRKTSVLRVYLYPFFSFSPQLPPVRPFSVEPSVQSTRQDPIPPEQVHSSELPELLGSAHIVRTEG